MKNKLKILSSKDLSQKNSKFSVFQLSRTTLSTAGCNIKMVLMFRDRKKGLSFDFFPKSGKSVLSSCIFVNLGLLTSWLILNLVLRTNYVCSKQWIPKLGHPMPRTLMEIQISLIFWAILWVRRN